MVVSAVGGEVVSGHRAGKQARLGKRQRQAEGREDRGPSSTQLEFSTCGLCRIVDVVVAEYQLVTIGWINMCA